MEGTMTLTRQGHDNYQMSSPVTMAGLALLLTTVEDQSSTDKHWLNTHPSQDAYLLP